MDTLERYNEIMTNYRNGKYGVNSLSMYQILEKAGEPNLFEEMSISDLEILIKDSRGFTRQMLIEIRDSKSRS